MTISLYYIPAILTLFAAVHKFIPPVTSRKILLGLSITCLAAFQYIRAWFIVHNLPLTHSALGIPFYSSIGLLVYCYAAALTDYLSQFSLRLMLGFIPGMISFATLGIFLFLYPENFERLIYYPEWNLWLKLTVTLSWAYSAFWIIRACRIVYIMVGKRNLARPPFNIFIIVTLVALPLVITGSISNIYSLGSHTPISIVYFSLMAFLALLTNGLAERYPNIMLHRRTPYSFRYKGEIPDDYRQQERIARQLKVFMKEEKPYRNEAFSMEGLSQSLDITQRQLSRIINDKYGENFNSFVNRHRIEEAKKLLEDPTHENLLQVSLDAGFNSYSVFYLSFKKFAGMTPRQYIKKNSNKA